MKPIFSRGVKPSPFEINLKAILKQGDILRAKRFEDNEYFCTIEVLSISPITLDELTEQHAKQENMGLDELKDVIRGIYPSENLYLIIDFRIHNCG